MIPVKLKFAVFTTFLSASKYFELKKDTLLEPQLFCGSVILALIVFFAFLTELSVTCNLPIISVSSIYSGFTFQS